MIEFESLKDYWEYVLITCLMLVTFLIGFVAWTLTFGWAWYFYMMFYTGIFLAIPTIVVILWMFVRIIQYTGEDLIK